MNTMHIADVEDFSQKIITMVLTCTMVLLALAGWASYMGFDKDALFVETLKIGIPLAVGGAAGYFYARVTKK
jgi:hypothetical protein